MGGPVTPQRLILAYGQGIFPWPVAGLPVLWFSPDPRYVLVPSHAHLGRSLRKQLRRQHYEIRADTAFEQVIQRCADVERPGQEGTWITTELQRAYTELHHLGYAHSIEAWQHDQLVGGLYGVSIGAIFCGESMFALAPEASKVAFATLLAQLVRWRFRLVDCQVHTPHLERFGATQWPREEFLLALHRATSEVSRIGRWQLDVTPETAPDVLDAARPKRQRAT